MNYSANYLIKILENNGYYFRRSSGSHQLYFHPKKNKTVIVPVFTGRRIFLKALFIPSLSKQAWTSLIYFEVNTSLFIIQPGRSFNCL
jgi:predicted RNA binding protein YcfA (HicA-like mRNA interferase family)